MPSVPDPDSHSHSLPPCQRGECGIDRPRATTSPVGTSSRQPPWDLFARQPPAVSVSPNAEAYLGLNSHGDVEWSMIRTVFTSVAQIAVIPVQDILGLGSDARMNRPGDGEANWAWRLREGALDREHAEKLRRLTELSGRL